MLDEQITALVAQIDAGPSRELFLEILARIYGAGFANGVGVPTPRILPPELATLMPEVLRRHGLIYEAQQALDRGRLYRQFRPEDRDT